MFHWFFPSILLAMISSIIILMFFSRELYVLSENQLFTWNIVRVRQGSFSEKVTRKESYVFILLVYCFKITF